MKKLLLFVLFAAAAILFLSFFFKITKERVKEDIARSNPYPTEALTPTPIAYSGNSKQTLSLFVPYWSLTTKLDAKENYESFIFFGVAAASNGIDTSESGAKSLRSFLSFVPKEKKKLLALRMIDSDTNFAILKSTAKQHTIINETMAMAKENNFDGIVLDLEVSAIPFDSLVKQISSFTELFYKEVKDNQLSFSLTIYGDVFYRARPFDVKVLAKNADTIMIMAYDFSKAKGNPGPNFPLQGSETYGYDYQKMTEDFLRVVPAERLTVVFGLFGYDWTVDDHGKATEQARAVTLSQIQSKFIDKCFYKSCSYEQDTQTKETQVQYVDNEGKKHRVWFEDMQSVAAKKAYLKTRGISSFSYWAHSYF